VGYRAALIQLAISFGAIATDRQVDWCLKMQLGQPSAQWAAAVRIAAQVHSKFTACYGVDDTGDIYNSANIRDFRSIVMAKTGGTRGAQTQRTRGAQTQRTRGAPANDLPAQPTPADAERL
jgi:hypothetical protein